MKLTQTFSLLHFVEPLEREPSFATRRMFGCLAIYLEERNVRRVRRRDPRIGIAVERLKKKAGK